MSFTKTPIRFALALSLLVASPACPQPPWGHWHPHGNPYGYVPYPYYAHHYWPYYGYNVAPYYSYPGTHHGLMPPLFYHPWPPVPAGYSSYLIQTREILNLPMPDTGLTITGKRTAAVPTNIPAERVQSLAPVLNQPQTVTPATKETIAAAGSIQGVIEQVWGEDQPAPLAQQDATKAGESIERYKRLIKEYSDELQGGNKTAGMHYNRAIAYINLLQFKNAIDDLNEAIRLAPGNPQYYYQRALVFYDFGKYEEMVNDCTEAIKRKHDFARCYYARSLGYIQLGKYKQAISDCDEALRLNPNSVRALASRAVATLQLKNHDAALADYNQVIALAPAGPQGYAGRAMVRFATGRYEQAVEDYSKEISLTPGDAGAYVGRGLSYLHLDKFENAVDDYSRALTLDPDNAACYYHRAVARMFLNQGQLAAEDAKKALRLFGWSSEQAPYLVLLANYGSLQAGKGIEKPLLVEAADKLSHDRWPYALVEYLLDKRPAEQVTAAARTLEEMTQARAYIGLRLAWSGDSRAASSYLNWVRENGAPQLLEYKLTSLPTANGMSLK